MASKLQVFQFALELVDDLCAVYYPVTFYPRQFQMVVGLAALIFRNEQDVEPFADGIDRRGESGRSAANNN
jgi:hypothetical protein